MLLQLFWNCTQTVYYYWNNIYFFFIIFSSLSLLFYCFQLLQCPLFTFSSYNCCLWYVESFNGVLNSMHLLHCFSHIFSIFFFLLQMCILLAKFNALPCFLISKIWCRWWKAYLSLFLWLSSQSTFSPMYLITVITHNRLNGISFTELDSSRSWFQCAWCCQV